MADEVRGMRGLTEDERSMAKLMFVTGQYTLAQVARIMRIDYNTLRAASSHEKWGDAREAYTLEVAGASGATMHALTEGFKLRCFRMFDRMMANYDEIMDRHEVHDSFQSFPFDNFWKVMTQMVEFMRAVGALQVNPQINVNMQQNIDQRTQQLVNLDGAKAKEALGQILQEFVRNRKPHEPAPLNGNGRAPQPETGQFR
jgi:hypothetical protein